MPSQIQIFFRPTREAWLFYAFIYSNIVYALPIWGKQASLDGLLSKLYKKALRHVYNKKGIIHTKEICKELKILPLHEAYRQSLRCLGYNVFHDNSKANLICDRSRNADNQKFKTPLRLGSGQGHSEMVNEWNDMPDFLRAHVQKSFQTFKQESKKHLLSKVPKTVCTNSKCIQCIRIT